MTKLIHRYFKLIKWLEAPTKNKPRELPGFGLELAVIGLHVMIGIGHAVLWLRG